MGRSRRARPLAKRSAPAHFKPAAYSLQGPVSPRGLAVQGTALCHWFPHVDRLHVCYRRILPVRARPGEGHLAEPIADVRPARRELFFMPPSGNPVATPPPSGL